uniref:Uncharacterized protein n=1 Tax=Oryza rufipogon TaxID=4529 RepID=A0A0E0QNN6_ORYRU
MTAEQKPETNERLMVARQNLPDVDIFYMNARHRSRQQNVMPGERSTHLARCNARYAARRDKPCAESIAFECLDGCNPSLLNLTTCLQTVGDVPATSTLQFEKTNTLDELDIPDDGRASDGRGSVAAPVVGWSAPETFGTGRRQLGLGIVRVRRCEWRWCETDLRGDAGEGEPVARRQRWGSVAARNSSAWKASAAT